MHTNIRFAAGIVAISLIGHSCLRAQSMPNTLRPYNGWNASAPQASLASQPQQQVFFQAQGSLSDGMPALPTANYSSGGGAPAGLPQLPGLPSLNYDRQPQERALVQPPIVDRQVLPDNNPPAAFSNPPPRQRTLPTQPVGYPQNTSTQSTGQSASDLRAIQQSQNTAQPGSGGNFNAQTIASGLPYVTPPPQTGRYPTSPYQGPRYYNAVYQQAVPVQTVPVQTVAAQTGGLNVPNAMNAAAQPAVLPQYQNTPGIYPTAYQQCAPAPSFPSNGAVPGTYVPPTFTPNLTPNLYSANNSGYSPLFSLGQENYNVLLGRGMIGQPTVYVPGQPFRNFFRYISP